MYVACDDTDSIRSMCTTYLATEIVLALSDYDLIGYPRLVRLNPAVPWKTRGNGALCLRFGRGGGTRRLVGRLGKAPIYSFARCAKPAPQEVVLELAGAELKRWSRISEDASPGLVVSRTPPGQKVYWWAARGLVDKSDVIQELQGVGASTLELCGGRGIIGAAAAMAWKPQDRTYEVLVYRSKGRWGTERKVNADDVAALDRRFPSTFNNFDPFTNRPAIVPHSPCPVLFGIRGDEPDELVEAMATVRSEEKDRWLLLISNQGTDDHIIRRWKTLSPNRSYQITGKVVSKPRTIAGGHVIFRLSAKKRLELDCAAYEPSKSFRHVVRNLVPGDKVTVLGELREEPRTLNIEKMHVLELAEGQRKVANPVCQACGKSMQSMGAKGGYRCRKCGAKASESSAPREPVSRALRPGWYEPPVCSRRHISKPLKRMPNNQSSSIVE